MNTAAKVRTVRIAAARMPTKWGVFKAVAFERETATGMQRVESALALVLGRRGPLEAARIRCHELVAEPREWGRCRQAGWYHLARARRQFC